jgi:protease PrsW
MLTARDILLGAIPAILWLAWIWKKDDRRPEPPALVLRVFVLGGLAALVQAWLRPRVEFALIRDGASLRDHLLDVFVVTAACEEFLKFLAFALGALATREWDEPLDGIVYGAAAGLGFAAIENAYFLAATGDTAVLWQRGFTATFAHVAFTSGLGFFVGLARLRHLSVAVGATFGALYAIGCHGAYDHWLARGSTPTPALLGTLPLLLLAFALKVRWARARSQVTFSP